MKKIVLTLLLAVSSLCAVGTIETDEDGQIWGLGIFLHAVIDHCGTLSSKQLDMLLGDVPFFFMDGLTNRQILEGLRFTINGKDVVAHAKSKRSKVCDEFARDWEIMIALFEGLVALGAGDLTNEEMQENPELMDRVEEFIECMDQEYRKSK